MKKAEDRGLRITPSDEFNGLNSGKIMLKGFKKDVDINDIIKY